MHCSTLLNKVHGRVKYSTGLKTSQFTEDLSTGLNMLQHGEVQGLLQCSTGLVTGQYRAQYSKRLRKIKCSVVLGSVQCSSLFSRV